MSLMESKVCLSDDFGPKISILGYGNMGKALFKYLLLCGVQKKNIRLTCRSEEKASLLNKQFDMEIVYICNRIAVSLSSYVFICVKPDMVETVCKEIANYLVPNCIVISLAASIEISKLEKWLTRIDLFKLTIYRSMPLISISKGSGIFPLFTRSETNLYHSVSPVKFLSYKSCQVFEVESEAELDQLTIFSACGLAYLAKLLKCYYDAGSALRMSKQLRNRVLVSTVKGLMDLYNQGDVGDFDKRLNGRATWIPKGSLETFESITEKVSSKGGITEASSKYIDTKMIEKNFEKVFGVANSKLSSLKN